MFNSQIKRVGRPDVDADILDPGEPSIPDELKRYYEQAPGLSRQERHRLEADGGSVVLHPVRSTLPGPRDDIRPPEVVSVDEYEHIVRLGQAEQLRRDAEFQRVIHAGDTQCQLCGRTQPGGQVGALTRDDGTELRLCNGTCAELVRREIQRRQWAARIDELLAQPNG